MNDHSYVYNNILLYYSLFVNSFLSFHSIIHIFIQKHYEFMLNIHCFYNFLSDKPVQILFFDKSS